MANKVFLELLGVVGSSQDPDFPNAIELLSFSFSGDPGKISEITIVKAVDIASPALLQKAASGDAIRSGTITFVMVSASTGKVPFLKYKMMGWTAPERHRCARLAVMNRPDKGAVHDED